MNTHGARHHDPTAPRTGPSAYRYRNDLATWFTRDQWVAAYRNVDDCTEAEAIDLFSSEVAGGHIVRVPSK